MYSVIIKIISYFIEVNASYGCTDSFFLSSKKPGPELKSELKFYKILADFPE